MQREGGAVGAESFETCPTDVIRATPERVWELLTNPARFGWLGVKVIESPARNLAVGTAKCGILICRFISGRRFARVPA